MCHGCCSNQVCRTRANAGTNRHEALAKLRLAIRNGGECHALLIVRAVSRQFRATGPKRLAQPSDITVPKNGKYAAAIRFNRAVIQFNTQRCKMAHQRLGHRESYSFHSLKNLILGMQW